MHANLCGFLLSSSQSARPPVSIASGSSSTRTPHSWHCMAFEVGGTSESRYPRRTAMLAIAVSMASDKQRMSVPPPPTPAPARARFPFSVKHSCLTATCRQQHTAVRGPNSPTVRGAIAFTRRWQAASTRGRRRVQLAGITCTTPSPTSSATRRRGTGAAATALAARVAGVGTTAMMRRPDVLVINPGGVYDVHRNDWDCGSIHHRVEIPEPGVVCS